MKLQDFLNKLNSLPDFFPISIKLPDGSFVPPHFHITEVGELSYKFIDCGGEIHSESVCLLQAWVANDVQHRMYPVKLRKIMWMAVKAFEFNNSCVEVEYGSPAIQYNLSEVELTSTEATFILEGKETDCLAPDKCGVKCCNDGSCACE